MNRVATLAGGLAVAIVAATVAAARSAAERIERNPDPYPRDLLAREPEGEEVMIRRPDGTALRAVVAGDGPTVVLAHGYAVANWEWNVVCDELTGRGYRVITFDQRGHGRSTLGSARQNLIDAVIHPTKDTNLTMLRAYALAEMVGPQHVGQLAAEIQAAVLAQMTPTYAAVATKNYRGVAELFDAAATKFSDGAGLVDPESDASAVVTADEAVRTAWVEAPLHASELDRMAEAPATAAQLADIRVPVDHGALTLICEPGQADQLELARAFNAKGGRCGRWSAMLSAGARFRALPNPADFVPFVVEEPKPAPPPFEPRKGGRLRAAG